MYIKDIMTKNVHTIPDTTTLVEIQDIFHKHHFHHLLVVDKKNHLFGVISDRDAERMASPFLGTDKECDKDVKNLSLPASVFMSTSLITVTAKTPVDTAAILLLENNISCLPVVCKDNVVEGIVSWKDLLKYYVYVASVDEGTAASKAS